MLRSITFASKEHNGGHHKTKEELFVKILLNVKSKYIKNYTKK